MTIEEADDVLLETAESIRAAIGYQHGLVADAHDTIAMLEEAWKQWDVEALHEMGVLSRRQADLVEAALETA